MLTQTIFSLTVEDFHMLFLLSFSHLLSFFKQTSYLKKHINDHAIHLTVSVLRMLGPSFGPSLALNWD